MLPTAPSVSSQFSLVITAARHGHPSGCRAGTAWAGPCLATTPAWPGTLLRWPLGPGRLCHGEHHGVGGLHLGAPSPSSGGSVGQRAAQQVTTVPLCELAPGWVLGPAPVCSPWWPRSIALSSGFSVSSPGESSTFCGSWQPRDAGQGLCLCQD